MSLSKTRSRGSQYTYCTNVRESQISISFAIQSADSEILGIWYVKEYVKRGQNSHLQNLKPVRRCGFGYTSPQNLLGVNPPTWRFSEKKKQKKKLLRRRTIDDRNISKGVPPRALKLYPSKYQKLKKIRTHPNSKSDENYDPHNIIQIKKIHWIYLSLKWGISLGAYRTNGLETARWYYAESINW